jgi:hypothetical protein
MQWNEKWQSAYEKLEAIFELTPGVEAHVKAPMFGMRLDMNQFLLG